MRDHIFKLSYFSALTIFLLILPAITQAQIEPPSEKFLFQEDEKPFQESIKKQREVLLQTEAERQNEVNLSAPQVKFDNENNIVSGEGGVIISGRGIRVQGDSGQVNLNTKDVQVQRDVLVTTPDLVVAADAAEFNIDTEVGEFSGAKVTLEDGAYTVSARDARKLNDVDFEFDKCVMSTCQCEDGTTPWTIKSSDVNLTREGYAHAYNARLNFWGVPILYTPWVAVPVKQERSSGLLAPEFGYSSRDGLRITLPTYLVLDGSSDMTLTPFTETKTRRGIKADYRESFSERSALQGRLVYSDETPRDGDFRGTDITGLSEPEIDDNRFGGYLQQGWSNSTSDSVPLSLVSDIRYVSDTLFLREMSEPEIGLESSRYTTSRMALRAGLNDYISTSLVGEYNQSLITPQETTFQRLPEFTMNATRSLRPFGFSPYGLKVTPAMQVQATHFSREEGFDGVRYDLAPSIKMPINYRNILNTELAAQFNQSFYRLNALEKPDSDELLDSATDRSLWRFSYRVASGVERVYTLPQDNLLTTLTSLGSRNQTHTLERVKHTLEPAVTFAYVPGTSQDHLPLFDSFDRVRQRSLVTYELMTRLIGSSGYLQGSRAEIEEFTPAMESLSMLDTLSPLTDFDAGSAIGSDTFGTPLMAGRRQARQIRDLATFRILQSYDYIEDKKDLDPIRDEFSDIGTQLYLYPTQDFGFGAASNFNPNDSSVSSWNLAMHFYDDRGDRLRFRYTNVDSLNVDSKISQLEGNLEIPITSRLRAGYYARYDEVLSRFIEQQAALRVSSQCDCWHFDIGYSNQINPDRDRVIFQFTLRGLGDLVQDFGFEEREKNRVTEE
jgi:LPS-assembly protein